MRQAQIGPWLIEQKGGKCYVDGQESEYDFDTAFKVLMDRLNDPMDKAARIIGYENIGQDGGIQLFVAAGYEVGRSVKWARGASYAMLSGYFTSEQLWAIATWMRAWENAVPLEECRREASKLDRIREIVTEPGYNEDQAALAQEILEILNG